ncbi:tumor protein p53 inducible nuclear protein isoform 1-T3 [Cochliomyia hominivorax]
MFSSLASFLFGSNTNCETNSETTATTTTADNGGESNERDTCTVDADNLIEVTSLTPSVTGAGGRGQSVIKRGKNRRNNARQQNKRKGINKSSGGSAKASSPLTAKQLTVPNSSDEEGEEFDEDEWFIVEKEDEEEDASPSRSDSEGENVPVIEVVKTAPKPLNAVAASSLAQQRRLQHINSHSLYSGPRPQKQRNYLQKTRNNTNNRSGSGLSVSTLSPSRTVNNDGRNGSGHEESADGGITRSLYVAPNANSTQSEEKLNTTANGLEACNKMDESWFVTPPPCFTSIGPINMETSPYENLLIEHPSMSVYHSIKTAQEATESFIKLDIGVNDMAEKQKANETTPKKNNQAVQSRNNGSAYRLDRQSVAQLKQELMARNVQKKQTKKERKDICRTAIKRANKVRDTQSRNHTQRRSDRQHSKIFSNANNNRKSNCC